MGTNDTLSMVPLVTTRDAETNQILWSAVAEACDTQQEILCEFANDLSETGHRNFWDAWKRHEKLLAIRVGLTAELRLFNEIKTAEERKVCGAWQPGGIQNDCTLPNPHPGVPHSWESSV